MTNRAIYDQFDKAFNRVSAYVILDKSGECVAKVAFKFPADGAGRLYAYVHWLGVPMVRGFAGGYGYDKRSAAVASAANQLYGKDDKLLHDNGNPLYHAFAYAIVRDSGEYWDTRLRDAGFDVIQAV
ncbi:hypothetical protein L905_24035 [Agrobacterium sp. TS43]|uniref:hypothetical protein n=1 Tax=Agrobacterium TaxID=357 RepID=UPI0004A0A2F4|nr:MULTISPECIES: hypothetical protein [Agrobacterium]KDR90955.1 hypothetical protein K538_07835 [Agrobacterium tumefaciens GW4]KVK43592.1 hypothetical protein L904_27055 [Agrobacterium sp. LY4]KVK43623.1 hypothetical protein L903_27080 [Agrobacterium sp. JL28]KVK57604.1 hypothetical protein L906_26975 [Agrobacterium sp. TS45]KVK58049.1 hypothetical protein L905_24035 [Agrobacterium sp. TS43]